MKITIKKGEPLSDKLSRWNEAFQKRMKSRALDKAEKLEEWHEKYAWYPMRLTTADTYSFAWFCKIRQKYETSITRGTFLNWNYCKKTRVMRYTSKDFFKLKLKGEIEDDNEGFVDMSHDGTNATINTSAGPKVYIKKTDPYDNISMWVKNDG